jgi:hypothetical protein
MQEQLPQELTIALGSLEFSIQARKKGNLGGVNLTLCEKGTNNPSARKRAIEEVLSNLKKATKA